jgi:hypothetical protein
MSSEAFALLGVFTMICVAAGVIAWRLLLADLAWGALLPAATAFAVLYLIGHRLGWTYGPTVQLFGFEVALPWEVLLALVTAMAVAGLHRILRAALG